MLELISPEKISHSKWRQRLEKAGIKGGWNYALDHAWLYEKIDTYISERPDQTPTILDVGCGNSMLHTFLEEELHLGIIGIDRIYGKCPFNERDKRMDLCINFLANDIFKENVDIVYWCSSIEHNTIPEIKQCIAKSFEALKPGGLFIATFAVSETTHYFQPAEQTNLSLSDAQETFRDSFKGETDISIIISEYKKNPFGLMERHNKRFGTDEIQYIVAACEQRKDQ